MALYFGVFMAFASICRGAVRATRQLLSPQEQDALQPLLADSGVKKRTPRTPRLELGEGDMKQEDAGVGEAGTPAGLLTGEPKKETFWTILVQVIFPFFAAGFGMSYGGIILNETNDTIAFKYIEELVTMVPPLLGLKGNLEMTFASRLSTYTNIGTMSSRSEQFQMIGANLLLVQIQAIIVSMSSAVITFLVYRSELYHLVVLCASATLAASIASLVLATLTAGVIIMCKTCNWNPDNIATPVVAALGDVVSIILLRVFSNFFVFLKDYRWHAPLAFICIYVALLPFLLLICKRNKHTGHLLFHGWIPIGVAMCMGLLTGMLMDMNMKQHPGTAVFQVLINGVGGNLAAIQASRMSTSLHHQGLDLGVLPPHTRICINPHEIFFSESSHSLTARVLITVFLPGQLVFTYILILWQFPESNVSIAFYLMFLAAGTMQVLILLYLVHFLTNAFWKWGVDPDNSTIPYLTAVGDFLGTVFLGLTFHLLSKMDLNFA